MPRVKTGSESDDDYNDADYQDNLDMLANVSAEDGDDVSEGEEKPRKRARASGGGPIKAPRPSDKPEGVITCPNAPCPSTFARRNALSRHLRMSCKYGPQGELIGRIPCPIGNCSWWGRPDNLPAHQIAKHGDEVADLPRKPHIPLPGAQPASKKRTRDSDAPKIALPTEVPAEDNVYEGHNIDPSLAPQGLQYSVHQGDHSQQVPEALILEALGSLHEASVASGAHHAGAQAPIPVQQHDLGVGGSGVSYSIGDAPSYPSMAEPPSPPRAEHHVHHHDVDPTASYLGEQH